MESWKRVWRNAVASVLSDAGLRALRAGLAGDDPALVQGVTTTPPPLDCVSDWPVEDACALAYAGWKGDGLATVGQAQEFFGAACARIDEVLGETGGCRWFINWFDETPREEMRRLLLPEVERELARRAG